MEGSGGGFYDNRWARRKTEEQSNPVNPATTNYPKPNSRVTERIAQQRAADEAAAQRDAQDYSWVSYATNPVNNVSDNVRQAAEEIQAQRELQRQQEQARQEELRRLEEERRMREEQERQAAELRQQESEMAIEELQSKTEQPTSNYMPYGDPRQKPNPVAPVVTTVESPVVTEEQPVNYETTNPVQPVAPIVTYDDRTSNNAFKKEVGRGTQNDEDEIWFYQQPAEEEQETSTPRRSGELRAEKQMRPYETPILFPTDYGGTTIPNMSKQLEGTGRPAIENDLPTIMDAYPNGILPVIEGNNDTPLEDFIDAQKRSEDRLNRVLENTPEEYRQGYEYDYPAKIAMNIANNFINTKNDFDNIDDRIAFINNEIGDRVFSSEEERVQAERLANKKYDTMVENGQVQLNETPLVTSNQVRETIDNIFAPRAPKTSQYDTLGNISSDMTAQEIYDTIYSNALMMGESEASARKTAYEGVQQWVEYDATVGGPQTKDYYNDSVALAKDEGYEEGTPEFEQAVYENMEQMRDEEVAKQIDSKLGSFSPETNNPLNNSTYDTLLPKAMQAARDAGIPENTNDYDRFIDNYINRMTHLYTQTEQEVRNQYTDYTTYAQELANGDARNIPPESFAETYRLVTGDETYAKELESEYERLKQVGLNDRQISAELYRKAADHQNPLARATDTEGNLHFDYVLAREGMLPPEMTYPAVDENGRGNAAYNELMNSVEYFDKDGMELYRGNDGTYWQGIPQADGTVKYEKYMDVDGVDIRPKYSAEDILSMYVNPNGGRNGESSWRGLENVFDGLTAEERAGMEELLAAFVRGGDLNAETMYDTEFANMTPAEYEKFVQLFLSKMPALQDFIDKGLMSREELENFFFKNIPDGNGGALRGGSGGSGSGYRSGYYRNYGGYGGYGYYPYRRSGGSSGNGYYYPSSGSGRTSNIATPVTTNQNQSRIYNIMKNWSF